MPAVMSHALPLRVALTRGAVVAAANWPLILVEFVVESVYKAALAIPILGGIFMVAVLHGEDIGAILDDGLLSAAQQLVGPLANAPVALVAFLAAMSVAGVGGAVVMFVVKGGTLGVLAQSEAVAADLSRRQVTMGLLRELRGYSLPRLWTSMNKFQRRSAVLALWLGLAYIVIGSLYLLSVGYGFRWIGATAWSWPLLVLLATSTATIAVIAVNLFFDLARVVMIAEDCSVLDAVRRVRRFLLEDARHVLGIFGAMGGVLLLATAASLTATAALALVAWVPLLGLLFVPLQIAFWIVRGLIFQYMSLATLCAYQSQYRRFSQPAATVPFPLRVHQA